MCGGQSRRSERLPLDLYLLIAVLSISGLAVIGVETGNGLLRWQSDLLVFSAGAAGMGYLACLIFVGFCFAFVAQIKPPGVTGGATACAGGLPGWVWDFWAG